MHCGTSLVVQWLGVRLPMQETRVQSLVKELGSHMPGTAGPACLNYCARVLWSPSATTREKPECHNEEPACRNQDPTQPNI